VKPQYLTKQEQAAILGHLQAARLALVALSNTLRPATFGGRVNVELAQQHARRVSSNNGHLLVWLNSIRKENEDGTDLTAHL